MRTDTPSGMPADRQAPAPPTPATARIGELDRGVIVISLVAVLGTIMSILDATIVNVAIAALARDLGTSLSRIQWVATGYLLALATVIPLTGWAADRFGAKRVFLVSVALFAGGSALAGLAPSAESLIAFRVLQGLGGGMILPAAITIITRTAGPQHMGRAMSVVGVPAMLAPMLGPVIGGWIVSDFSWRWIFYVNVPIGIVTLALAYRILPRDDPHPGDRLDVLGLVLLSPGLTALVYGLAETTSAGGFGSAGVLVPIGVGAILVSAFVWHALHAPNPLLDLRLFRHRAVAAASGTTLLFAVAFFGMLLLLPLYFQIVRGESALAAGLLLVPRGLGAALTLPVAGRITDRSGAGRVVPVGLVILALGTVPFTQVSATTSYWLLGGAQFVQGLGVGMVMQPAMAAAYQVLDRAAVARATSALNTLQRVGGSIGTALVAVVLQHEILSVIPAAGAAGLSGIQQASASVQEQLAPQLAEAFGHTFWMTLVVTGVAVIPALGLSRPHRSASKDASGPATPAVPASDTDAERPSDPQPHVLRQRGACRAGELRDA